VPRFIGERRSGTGANVTPLAPRFARSRVAATWLAVTLAVLLAGCAPGVPTGAVADPRISQSAIGAVSSEVTFVSDGARIGPRNSLYVWMPSQVDTGSRFVVRGKVSVARSATAKPRPVRLQERSSGRWQTLGSVRSTKRGDFVIGVQAGVSEVTYALRVVAPKVRGLGKVRSTVFAVRIVAPAQAPAPTPTPPAETWDEPEYPGSNELAPAGSSSDWSYMSEHKARWDPCKTITWAYNPTNGYEGSLGDVKRAFARISGVSGLRFKYVGETSHVPFVEGSPSLKEAKFGIAWAEERQVPKLAGNVVGLGGGSWLSNEGPPELSKGRAVFDYEHALRAGFDLSGSGTWGQVFVHEIMHALGLGHASEPVQVMAGTVSSLNHRFGAGDLTGMSMIGADQGCF
jgi:hypothetical protein